MLSGSSKADETLLNISGILRYLKLPQLHIIQLDDELTRYYILKFNDSIKSL